MPEAQTDRQTTSRFEAEQVRAGLEQIRLRLLDLTTRNKLLSFRHTRSTLRIVDADLDKLYAEVVAGQKLSFLYLPQPTNEEILIFGEKPAARQYAEQLGWSTSFDLPPGSGRSQCLPVLHYKEDFEALVRKIGATAKTTIEESGVNLLHLVFGFLEWRESDDSTQVRQAPLLVVPIYLLTPKAREEDRSVKVQYAGEDLNTNLSLVEKMRRDFNIDIPTLLEDESPEHYFQRFDRILEQKRDWRICRQVSLGLLSFGKLLMYLDLDADRWPEAAPLANHPRLVDIFAGRQATGLEFASEYDLDEETKKGPVPPVICEADSSQHSALVDAARGKNLVIEGPPGTGKSQTITNLISTFLGQGKRVLFIAEKMAALNVVKRRLDQYGLGDFCLELHSHKTSKIGLLKSLDTRIDAHRGFGEPSTLAHKLGLLANRREELTKYVRLLNTPYASIAQSPFELIWHREEVRRGLPPELLSPQSVVFSEAHRWDFSALQEHKDTVGDFQAHLLRFQDAGGAIDKSSNPWSWLPPCELDHSAQFGLIDTLSKLRNACDSQRTLLSAFSDTYQQVFEDPADWLIRALSWPVQIAEPSSLALSRFFASFSDSASYSVVHEFTGQLRLYAQLISRMMGGTSLLDTDVPEQIEQHIQSLLAQGLTDFTLEKLRNLLDTLKDARRQAAPAERSLYELASALNVQAVFSLRCLTDLIIARDLLEQAPLELLHLRDKKFESEGFVPLLIGAKRESNELAAHRDTTAKDFVIDGPTTASDLDAAASVIELTPWIKRWFGSRYRQAIALFAANCQHQEKKKRQQMVTSLRYLAQCKRKLDAFSGRQDLKERLSTDFRGVNTDWDDLIAVAAWYETIHIRLPDHQPFAQRLRDELLQLPTSRLKGILSSSSNHFPRGEELRGLLDSLENIHKLLPHLDFERGEMEIDLFLREASKVAAYAEPLVDIVRPLSLPSQTTGENLLLAVGEIREARGMRRSLDGNEPARNILGEIFHGTETESEAISQTLLFVLEVQQSSLPERLKTWLLDQQFSVRKAWLNDWVGRFESNSQLLTTLEREVIAAIGIDIPFAKKTSNAALEKAITSLDRCVAARNLLPMWIDVQHAAKHLRDKGLHYLTDIVTQGALQPDLLKRAFDFFFYDSLVRKLFNEHPELWRLSGTSHEETRSQFCDLDKAVIELTRLDIAYRASRKDVPRGFRGTVVKETTELALVQHEIDKQKGHIPIRQLLLRAGGAIQALKPCFMMSPMSVAQFLAPGQLSFDLIVMDEASQLRPEDALGAIARGTQLVVVGDPMQLPPTSFFQRALNDEDDEDEKTAAAEGESILDIALGRYQPARRLRWHYRSQHHSLIAFSNEEFYGGDLVVFPSAYHFHPDLGVKYVSAQGVYENRRNPLEAERVVEAILEHIAIHPGDSLGVVTMNFEQRELIEELLDARLRDDSFSSTWIEGRESTPEPFFIKNLENVQGDERDVIFISVTYGRDPQGNIFQRFSGVNSTTGHRRLNVLITRAKKRTVVFSSLDADLIQTTANTPWGVKALKGYLDYANKGISAQPEISPGAEPSNEHEAAIGAVLKEHGYDVVPQVGVSGYFIDLAVRHPSKPGVFLLGIEFDGKSYHSGRSARDRDRLRQMTLVNQGWKIHRIWSTDWFKNRDAEIDRLLRKVRSLETIE